MKKHLLPITAFASLGVAMILIMGCFSRLYFFLGYFTARAHGDIAMAALDGGRVTLQLESGIGRPGLVIHSNVPRVRLPDAKRALWEFDAKTIAMKLPGVSIAFVEFPFSVAILPCVIAPIFWIKRRRRNEARGFPISTTV